jgi:hypothetical protein
MRIFPKFF